MPYFLLIRVVSEELYINMRLRNSTQNPPLSHGSLETINICTRIQIKHIKQYYIASSWFLSWVALFSIAMFVVLRWMRATWMNNISNVLPPSPGLWSFKVVLFQYTQPNSLQPVCVQCAVCVYQSTSFSPMYTSWSFMYGPSSNTKWALLLLHDSTGISLSVTLSELKMSAQTWFTFIIPWNARN